LLYIGHEGYYLIITETKTIIDEDGSPVGDFYKCEENEGKITCTFQTGEAIPIGYLIH